MQVPYGEAPPIQAPPNYQTILRHCVDQNSGAPLRIYSVVPIQQVFICSDIKKLF